MPRLATIAAGAGGVTGLSGIAVWLHSFAGLSGMWVAAYVALSVILIVNSLVALVGPKKVFYSQAGLAALLAVTEWAGSGTSSMFASLIVTVAAAATFILSVLAARHEQRISEQSHPMNLPVFG